MSPLFWVLCSSQTLASLGAVSGNQSYSSDALLISLMKLDEVLTFRMSVFVYTRVHRKINANEF